VFFILFLILTNIVFDVEVIHSKKEIRNLLTKELASNGLKKYTLKKSYKEINKIKEKILNKYPDEIEWLEIEPYGTKYIVRVEERKIVKQEKDNNPRNIIAKKSGVLRKVIALKGDIVKDMDDYVNKGDLIVNGELIFNNKVTGKVKATGTVYAEVWYVTKTEYPFAYYSKKPTGKVQDIYTISFLNHSFELTLHKFKTKNIKEKILLQNPLIPFKITKQHQSETKIINQVLTFEQALNNAEQDSINKVKSKLNKNEYIIRSKYLKSTVKDSTMEVEMFFAVYEDITAYQEIG
jgi:similar to stage IV sporulation protein